MPVELGRRTVPLEGFHLDPNAGGERDGSWDTGRSSLITDHDHDARHWWDRCSTCGLGEAAHADRVVPF